MQGFTMTVLIFQVSIEEITYSAYTCGANGGVVG